MSGIPQIGVQLSTLSSYREAGLHASEALIFTTHVPLLTGQVTYCYVGKAFKLETLNAIRNYIDQTYVCPIANQSTLN
jgi:hypothetical protein